ncbi:MAG TPA: acetyl-CoA hydrolase/transferase C-terminal domain-containing protein [Dyella sp.]|uniref:acetyl-CoA hydrolase/transferase family protein n=1 Tax=Dyella sp. TaxID=1869338 RepID=UPI002D769F28|nr:acetyl-CoA hydrolase/transferase C-terminal domain-containing protein [Dyella sp.]HET6553174.1 acetyl-CoA hydrolase/transferase C-terminal domain-containing protein [Dyella sp.]
MSWIDQYRNKLMTASEAVSCVESNMRVYIHPGCAEPEALVEALIARAPHVKNVEVVHLLTLGSSPYCAAEMAESFRHNALFVGGNVRQAVKEGRADYTPIFLSEVEALFETGEMTIDVAFIQVSPPDPHGYCSFGVGVDTTLTAAKFAHRVVAQVNAQMPRTYGDSFIHVSQLDAIVEVSQPLCELKKHPSDPITDVIGANVASLIEDGAVLQCGIGGIPDAVLPNLIDRRDLGVHTELLSDNAIPLIEAGVINGERKNFKPRKVILGFVLGGRNLFDFVDENPIFEFHPSAYTNDPWRIAQNHRMVAINSAIEVDLTGQVCAESIGPWFYSGFGGQLDFIRGAARSKGGKPIIALPSTAKDETVSRIVPCLAHGAGVLTGRADVHYVVSEYGIAYLHGRTIRQRAEALIQIAHPKFRNQLHEYCEKQRWFQRNALEVVQIPV